MKGEVLTIGPVLKYPGAKWRIADWIISQMPRHHSYLEPYFGSGAVLFRKSVSNIETANDLDGDVVSLFRIIRDCPEKLSKLVAATPYSRSEYNASYLPTEDTIESARRFIVRCCQGHGFRTNGYKVGWKNDVQGRERAYALRSWYQLPALIEQVAERLRKVQIENMPAVDLMKRFRYPNVLIYADPPYVLHTRAGKQYKHEMTDQDHIELLEVLDKHPGPVLLSGYASQLYDERLQHWERKTAKALAEGGRQREEVLWMNPVAAKSQRQTLFG